MVQLRELTLRTDPEIVMARLARKIGRGHDAIYHGTRHLPSVLRMGKLLPSDIGDTAVFFTRSPDVAAYWANTTLENEQFRGGILVLNRASLTRNYRLEPSHYPEKKDEREESIWDRCVHVQRHLLGVVRQPDANGSCGWWDLENQEQFWTPVGSAIQTVRKGRAEVRRIILQQREQTAAVSP
jgi:hypothetical protein